MPGQMQSFPRPALFLGAAAVLAAMLTAGLSPRPTGLVTNELVYPDAQEIASRVIRFEDQPGGAVLVRDASTGEQVELITSGNGHFLRATLRGLVRERRQHGASDAEPFRVAAWNDGRVTLEDGATGRRIELIAFGPDNMSPFARLLPHGKPGPQVQAALPAGVAGSLR